MESTNSFKIHEPQASKEHKIVSFFLQNKACFIDSTDYKLHCILQKSLIRQKSLQFAYLAENLVVPVNKRSIKRTAEGPEHTSQAADVESQPVDATDDQKSKCNFCLIPKSFPRFIITISIVQVFHLIRIFLAYIVRDKLNNIIVFRKVLIYYFGGEYLWLYLCNDPYRRHELWRYFTTMLVHGS